MKISKEAVDKAVNFVKSHSRRVDNDSLAHHFGWGSKENLLNSLSAYQNSDGGFGNAIEPDFRVTDSSTTATTVAFQYLIEHEIPSHSEIVQKGIDYLVTHFDKQNRSWPPVCKKITEFPRANWWNYYPPIAFKPNDSNWANPNIEIIGIFNRYSERVDPSFLNSLNEQATSWLNANESAEPHALQCAVRYGESLSGDNRQFAKDRLTIMVQKSVTTDTEKWAKYSPQPTWFARHPDDLLVDAFGETLNQNIDFVMNQQSHDGSWQPTWKWGRYDNEWTKAKTEWAGYLTSRNLKMLADFGRCELSVSNYS